MSLQGHWTAWEDRRSAESWRQHGQVPRPPVRPLSLRALRPRRPRVAPGGIRTGATTKLEQPGAWVAVSSAEPATGCGSGASAACARTRSWHCRGRCHRCRGRRPSWGLCRWPARRARFAGRRPPLGRNAGVILAVGAELAEHSIGVRGGKRPVQSALVAVLI